MKPEKNLHTNYTDLLAEDSSTEMYDLVGSLDKLYNSAPLPPKLASFSPVSQLKTKAVSEKTASDLPIFQGQGQEEYYQMLNPKRKFRLFPALTGLVSALALAIAILALATSHSGGDNNNWLRFGQRAAQETTANVVDSIPTATPTAIPATPTPTMLPTTSNPTLVGSPTPFPTYTPIAVANEPFPMANGLLERQESWVVNKQVFPKEYREVPLQIYASKESASSVVDKLHQRLVAAGYKRVHSDNTEISSPVGGNQLAEFYTKPDAPDIYADVGPLPIIPEGGLEGPNPLIQSIAEYPQKFAALRAQGYQTIAFVRVNNGLRLAMLASEHNELPPEVALKVLQNYLTALYEGNYQVAASFYGGSLDLLRQLNPQVNPDDKAKLLEQACKQNGFQCLQVKSITTSQRPTPYEYEFFVEFQTADGQTFVHKTASGTTTMLTFKLVSKNAQGLIMTLPPRNN